MGPHVAHPGELPPLVELRKVEAEREIIIDVDEDLWCFAVIAERRRQEDGAWTAWVRYAGSDGTGGIIRPDRLRRPFLVQEL